MFRWSRSPCSSEKVRFRGKKEHAVTNPACLSPHACMALACCSHCGATGLLRRNLQSGDERRLHLRTASRQHHHSHTPQHPHSQPQHHHSHTRQHPHSQPRHPHSQPQHPHSQPSTRIHNPPLENTAFIVYNIFRYAGSGPQK